MKPTFNNLDLQKDSLGDTIQLDPIDIQSSNDDNLDQSYILDIADRSYFYSDETERNNDRDLALGFLLESMQNEDGVSMYATVDGNEFACTIHAVKKDTDGTIYLDVMDMDEVFYCVSVERIQAGDYDMPQGLTLDDLEKHHREHTLGNIRLGDYVETTPHGHRGRVKAINHTFSETSESDAWFERQEPAYPKSARAEKWYSILCHPSGSVMVAESRVNKIEKFDFENPWADDYFRD